MVTQVTGLVSLASKQLKAYNIFISFLLVFKCLLLREREREREREGWMERLYLHAQSDQGFPSGNNTGVKVYLL